MLDSRTFIYSTALITGTGRVMFIRITNRAAFDAIDMPPSENAELVTKTLYAGETMIVFQFQKEQSKEVGHG